VVVTLVAICDLVFPSGALARAEWDSGEAVLATSVRDHRTSRWPKVCLILFGLKDLSRL